MCFLLSTTVIYANKTQWIIVDAKVYDVSKFANLHPGGSGVLYSSSIGEIARELLTVVLVVTHLSRPGRDSSITRVIKRE